LLKGSYLVENIQHFGRKMSCFLLKIRTLNGKVRFFGGVQVFLQNHKSQEVTNPDIIQYSYFLGENVAVIFDS
jgi:hypothetical protein